MSATAVKAMAERRPDAGRRTAARARLLGWGLLSPALVILLIMTIAPTIYLVYVSFRKENLLGPGSHFNGFDNFVNVLSNPDIWWDGAATLIFVTLSVTLELALGLGLALLLNRRLRETNFLTALFITPLGIAPVVSALVFRVLFDPAFGWIDWYLQSWHIISEPIDWFGSPVLAWFVVILLDVWQWTPFVALILLAGLSGIPGEPKEAALVDGATPGQIFRHITLPFLRSFIAIALVLRAIEAFKTFGSIFVLTGGGPGISTEVINLSLYRIALQNFDVGAAAALGLIFLFFLSLIMGQLLRVLGRNTDILED